MPEGEPADDVDDRRRRRRRIGYPCVIKAQVLIGGRGKAGGIKIAKDATEARAARRGDPRHGHLGPRRGFTVHEVWVEQASEIDAEYYASIILDRSEKKLLVILSRMGGMDVEEIAENDPDALVQRHVDPLRRAHHDDAAAARRRRRASTRTSSTASPSCSCKLYDAPSTRTRP